MDKNSGALSMHLQSGIPVLAIEGNWGEQAQTLLRESIGCLALSAHFEVILDLSRALRAPLYETRWWQELNELASALTTHYGRLKLVGTREQARMSACCPAAVGWRWAASLEEALCTLKGVGGCPGSLSLQARIVMVHPSENDT